MRPQRHWSAGVGLLSGPAWALPARFNIGVACSDAWVGEGRTALIHERGDGGVERYSFEALSEASNRLANILVARGVVRGDRVAVLLPQVPEAAIAHLAIYKLGGIAVPLFQLFGPDALEYRLQDCGAVAIITDTPEKLAGLELPALRHILRPGEGWLEAASPYFTALDTLAEEPALIIYTSGTTGPPKGALHAHRTLLGHLPGVEWPQEMLPKAGDLFWTPADWAWIGGLLDVLLPSLFHGVPVLAHRAAKFDPEFAFALMAKHGVRNAFLPPTALRVMRGVAKPVATRLRSIGSGGESLGAEILEWGRQAFGLTMNEFYGQTECNLVVATSAGLFGSRPGWIGRAVPGHEVTVLGEPGDGEIAVRRGSPSMFLGYWNRPEATAAKFDGEWLRTGDRGAMSEDGWFRFIGRDDDVITSSGYRIGPGEIEDALMRHPGVAAAAVIGVPDALRTERVVAVVVLAPGATADAATLQDHVRQRVAAHAYPREVHFVPSLPTTATGKIMRGVLRRQFSQETA